MRSDEVALHVELEIANDGPLSTGGQDPKTTRDSASNLKVRLGYVNAIPRRVKGSGR